MMPFFTTFREKRLWLWACAVMVTIFSTLFIRQPLIKILGNQDIQAIIFVIGMLLIGVTITLHGLKTNPSKIEVVVLLGIIAVYVLFFLRLGIAERSHLMEYSVLAIFIHKALIERASQGIKMPSPAALAFIITFLIGVMDECIQLVLPNRVFDPIDILFNGIAVTMAIGSIMVLKQVKTS